MPNVRRTTENRTENPRPSWRDSRGIGGVPSSLYPLPGLSQLMTIIFIKYKSEGDKPPGQEIGCSGVIWVTNLDHASILRRSNHGRERGYLDCAAELFEECGL